MGSISFELVGIFFSSYCSGSWSDIDTRLAREDVTKETRDKKARGSKKEIRIEFLLFKQTYYEGVGYILFLEEILMDSIVAVCFNNNL